jgi:ribosome assembly protein YihI (activator of Der GTPase)
MPSKSAKQARTMAAAAHNPKFAKKVGIPTKVAEEFNEADKGKGIIKPKGKPKKQKGNFSYRP